MLGNGRNVTQAVLRSQLPVCENFAEGAKFHRTEITEEELVGSKLFGERPQPYG